MDDKTGDLIAQAAIILIQSAFQILSTAGKSQTEIDRIFWEEKAKFEKRKPEDLPDV